MATPFLSLPPFSRIFYADLATAFAFLPEDGSVVLARIDSFI